MSIKPIHPVEHAPEAHFEPFPEPKTMPEGWDMSELMALYNPQMVAREEDELNLEINLDINAGVPEEPVL
ncbi:MAG: hypothetical protein M1281_00345 [Chloroflexi bacterium]|nr:hypothetical protein [Chloroflexota bacterium]